MRRKRIKLSSYTFGMGHTRTLYVCVQTRVKHFIAPSRYEHHTGKLCTPSFHLSLLGESEQAATTPSTSSWLVSRRIGPHSQGSSCFFPGEYRRCRPTTGHQGGVAILSTPILTRYMGRYLFEFRPAFTGTGCALRNSLARVLTRTHTLGKRSLCDFFG